MSYVNYATISRTSGVIFNIGKAPTVDAALELQTPELDVAINVPSTVTFDDYWDDATEDWLPRPEIVYPSASYDLTTLPVGTFVKVINEVGDTLEITDLSETLTLTDPGDYLFFIQPPEPFLPLLNITVEIA